MLHYSQEAINSLGARSWDKGLCQWNWALLRDSLLSKHMGMIGSSYSMVSNEIVLKSSFMDIGNLVISSINGQRNRQADPILVVWLIHRRILLFCHRYQLMLVIWCQKTDYSREFPLVVQCQQGFLGMYILINNHRVWPVTIICMDLGVEVG